MTSKDSTAVNPLKDIQEDKDHELIFERISEIIEPLIAMVQIAVRQTEPVVDWVIRTKSLDTYHIESLLDRLLDYSLHSDEGLKLFKKLLRYYFPLNPSAVATYINAYREMTEDDYSTVEAQAVENEEQDKKDAGIQGAL